jgi:hypothetical protein
MEYSDHYVHDNQMVFGIVCCCFVCFMFAGCAFIEKGERRHSISLDFEGECARLFGLVFALHENWREFGSNWCTGLGKDEELRTYDGEIFLHSGDRFWQELLGKH